MTKSQLCLAFMKDEKKLISSFFKTSSLVTFTVLLKHQDLSNVMERK